MLISFALSALIFLLPPVDYLHAGERSEVCPNSTFFIGHGKHTKWTRHKHPLCTIGGHDFYGDSK